MFSFVRSLALKVATLYLALCHAVYAAGIPTAPTVGGVSGSNTNVLTWFKGLLKEGSGLVSIAIAAAAFVWVAWIIIADVNEARGGRKEWGAVGLTAVVGISAILLVSYLLALANGIF